MNDAFAYLVQGLAQGGVYALIAIGFSLIYRSSGLLNLAFGEVVMLASLVAFTMMADAGVGFWLAGVVCIVVAGMISMATDALILQPILKTGNIANALVASVGLLIIFNQVGLIVWGADPLTYPENLGDSPVHIGSATVAVQSLWIMGISLGAVIALQVFLRRTPLGTAMRATAMDRVASQLMGISPFRVAMTAALIAGVMAGLSGILLGSLYFASYTLGGIGIKGIAAATIGGFGDIRGAIAGGLLVGLAESFGTAYVPSLATNIAWLLMIAVLMVRPQGILGVAGRRDD